MFRYLHLDLCANVHIVEICGVSLQCSISCDVDYFQLNDLVVVDDCKSTNKHYAFLFYPIVPPNVYTCFNQANHSFLLLLLREY